MTDSNEVNVEIPTKLSTFKIYVKCVLASIIMALQLFSLGTIAGYSSTAIPSINSVKNIPFRLSLNEQSWFGSIILLTAIPGCFFGGILMDTYGRKLVLLTLTIPTVIGWVIIIGAQSASMAIVGRAITGLTGVTGIPISFAYTSELAPPKIRGLLMSLLQLASNIGILFTYMVGTYVPWNSLAIACAAINCLAMCLLLLLPESPRWLLLKGHKEEGLNSLNWLRGSKTESEKEMLEIMQSLKDISKMTPWKFYFKSPLLKSTLASLALFTIDELAGLNCIRLYTVTIFQMSGSDLEANMQTILVGSAMVLGSILCTTFIDFFERRNVFMLSLFVSGIGMATIGTYVKAKDYFIFVKEELSFLPLVGLILATLGYAFGSTGIVSIITCEMFSTQARGRMISMGYAINFLSGFATTNLFLLASVALGEATVFWFFGGVCLFSIVLGYFIIPKTKGLSIEEIQNRND